jgi:AcrR family transcriptional regulator
MGIVERKEREKIERRQQILDAARKLFLEQGFEKTSIRNIADAIEYSPATIYLYYKDKNELLFALHQEAFGVLMSELQAIVQVADPFERIIDMGNHYLKFAFENPELYDLMFIMEAPLETLACGEEVWDDSRKAFGLLQFLVGQCIEAGYFKGYQIEDLSLMIWSFVHGLATIHNKNRMSIFPVEEHKTRMQNAFDVFVAMMRKL